MNRILTPTLYVVETVMVIALSVNEGAVAVAAFSQDNLDAVVQRLQGPKPVPNESQTALEHFANFTEAWINSQVMADAERRRFNSAVELIRKELRSVPSISLAEAARVDALVRKEMSKKRLGTEIAKCRDQRARIVSARKRGLEYDEIFGRLLQQQDLHDGLKSVAYNLEAQEARIVEIIGQLDATDRTVVRFKADYFMSKLGSYGPNALIRDPLFRDQMHWPSDRVDSIVFGFDYEVFELAKIVPIKRATLAEFLRTLSPEQLDLLAHKLGILPSAIPQIADVIPACDLKRVFSESIGDLPINYNARTQLMSLSKLALESLSESTVESERSETIEQLHAVAQQIVAFPPGELGCLNELRTGFEAELTRLRGYVSPDLTSELSELLIEITRYQTSSATPWKWTGDGGVNVQFSFGELEDNELVSDVTENVKHAFSNIASTRSLVADPTERLLSHIQLKLQDEFLGLSSSQGVEIRNAQVNSPGKHEFQNYKERLDYAKAQIAIVTNRLIPRQSARLSAICAQHLFFEYGPYNYFQRPDIVSEFAITREQQEQMNDVAKTISERIESEVHPFVTMALHEFFQQLSDDEQCKAEGLLGSKWSDISEALLRLRGERAVRDLLIDPFGPKFRSRKTDITEIFRF